MSILKESLYWLLLDNLKLMKTYWRHFYLVEEEIIQKGGGRSFSVIYFLLHLWTPRPRDIKTVALRSRMFYPWGPKITDVTTIIILMMLRFLLSRLIFINSGELLVHTGSLSFLSWTNLNLLEIMSMAYNRIDTRQIFLSLHGEKSPYTPTHWWIWTIILARIPNKKLRSMYYFFSLKVDLNFLIFSLVVWNLGIPRFLMSSFVYGLHPFFKI